MRFPGRCAPAPRKNPLAAELDHGANRFFTVQNRSGKTDLAKPIWYVFLADQRASVGAQNHF
tara:strand:+ start:1181 stop:1366 length:186 start_codon:yes stop_codon:yes gene_type:complete